jgi:FSR family fosmidomycin resistance protein-like MFS transporter
MNKDKNRQNERPIPKRRKDPPVPQAKLFQTGRVITMSFGHFVHDTYSAFLPPLLPVFIQNLFLSKAEAGLLTVFMQIPSLSQPVIGFWADRVRLNGVVFLAPALTGVMMSLLGAAPGYTALAVLLMLAGLNSAALHAVGPVLTGKLSGKSLGRGMSYWMVGGELGRALGPLIIVTVISQFTIQRIPWLMIAGFFASIILYIRLKDVHAVSPHDEKRLPWRSAVGRMKFFLIPLIGLITFRAFMYAALTVFLPIFLTEEGLSLWSAGASLTVVQAAGVLGALLGGSASDFLGRRLVLSLSIAITPILMWIFLGTQGWIRFPLLFVLGLLLISTTPVIMAVVQENFPENRALANGIYMCLSFLIRSSVVVLVGGLGDRFGLHMAFTISALVMLLGLPFIFLLPKDKIRIR